MRNSLKLKLGQLWLLYRHLESTPKTTLKEIRIWIKDNLNVSYILPGLAGLVKSLGFVFRNSKLMPRLPSLQVQKDFIAKLDSIISAAPDGSILLYGGGVHPTFCGKPGGCWVPKGTTPIISTATGRQRLNIIAALCTHTGEFVYEMVDSVNREVFIKLLEKIRREFPDAPEIHLVVDNARYHRAKDMQTWLDNQDGTGLKIQLIFLPPYCPHLNPVEKLWKKYHDKVTRNKVQVNFKEFVAETAGFFDNLQDHWEEIGRYVNIELKPKDPANYLNVSQAELKQAASLYW